MSQARADPSVLVSSAGPPRATDAKADPEA